jgi:hypothetical protein
MDKAPVIARVLLRSAAGERPGIDVPIAAGNVARLAPSREAVEAVAEHFRRAGFSVLGTPGNTIGISGSKARFEGHFGVELVSGTDHAYTVHHPRERSPRAGTAQDPFDPTSIPIDSLPPTIRGAVSQVALEAAVSGDQPRVDP